MNVRLKLLLGILAVLVVAAAIITGLLVGEVAVLALPLAVVGVLVFAAKPDWAVLVILALFLAETPDFIKGVGPLTPTNALGALLGFLFLLRIAATRDVSFFRRPQILIFLLIGMLFFVGVALSPYRTIVPELERYRQTAERADLFIGKLAFLMFVLTFLPSPDKLKRALLVVVAIVVLGGVLSINGWLAGERIQVVRSTATAEKQVVVRAEEEGRPTRVQSTAIDIANNANRLSFASTFSLAILFFYMRFQTARWRWLIPSLIFVLVVTIFLTASRSGFLGLVILFVLLFFDDRQRITGRMMMIGTAVMALALVLAVIPQQNFERIFNLNPEENSTEFGTRSFEDRVQTIEDFSRVILERPWLGVGLGHAKIAHYQQYGTFVDIATKPPHNSWLWAWVEGGIFVLLAYVVLFVVTWLDLRRMEAAATAPDTVWIVKSLKVGLILFLFFTIFADFWLSEFLYLIVGGTLALKARIPVPQWPRRVLRRQPSLA